MRSMATNDCAAIPAASDSSAAPLASSVEYPFPAFVPSRPLASTTLAKMRLRPLVLLPSAAFANTIPHSAGVSDSTINIPARVRVVDNHRDGGPMNRLLRTDEPMGDEKRMSVEPFVEVFESLSQIAQGMESAVGKEVSLQVEKLHDVLAIPRKTTDKAGGVGVHSNVVAKKDIRDTEEHIPETDDKKFHDAEEHFTDTREEKFHDAEEHFTDTDDKKFHDAEEHFPDTHEEKFHDAEEHFTETDDKKFHDAEEHFPGTHEEKFHDAEEHFTEMDDKKFHDADEHIPGTHEEKFYDAEEHIPETHDKKFHDGEEPIPEMRRKDVHESVEHIPEKKVHDAEEPIPDTTKLDEIMPSGFTEDKKIQYAVEARIEAELRGDVKASKAAGRKLDLMIDQWKATRKTLDDVLPRLSGVKSSHFFTPTITKLLKSVSKGPKSLGADIDNVTEALYKRWKGDGDNFIAIVLHAAKYDPVVDESAIAETWSWALKKFPAVSNQQKEEMEAAIKKRLKTFGRVRAQIEKFDALVRKKAASIMARISGKFGRPMTLIMEIQDQIATLIAKRLTTLQNSFVYLRREASDNVA